MNEKDFDHFYFDSKNLTIDPEKLPEEWQKQPVLYDQACQSAEEIQRMRDQAKLDLEVDTAKRKQKIREMAERKKEKVTEGSVNEKTIIDSEVIRSTKLLNTLNVQLSSARSKVMALEMKKKALENLVSLTLGRFYSIPNEGRQLKGGPGFEDIIRRRDGSEQRELLAANKEKRRHRTDDEISDEEKDHIMNGSMSSSTKKELEKHLEEKQGRRGSSSRRGRRSRSND